MQLHCNSRQIKCENSVAMRHVEQVEWMVALLCNEKQRVLQWNLKGDGMWLHYNVRQIGRMKSVAMKCIDHQNTARQEFEDIKLTRVDSRCERVHRRVKHTWQTSECTLQVQGGTRC